MSAGETVTYGELTLLQPLLLPHSVQVNLLFIRKCSTAQDRGIIVSTKHTKQTLHLQAKAAISGRIWMVKISINK